MNNEKSENANNADDAIKISKLDRINGFEQMQWHIEGFKDIILIPFQTLVLKNCNKSGNK